MIVAPVLFTTASAHGGPKNNVKHEQREHRAKIAHGVQNGQLTRKEAARLEMEQRKIQHYKKMAMADGVVTPAEHRFILQEQRRAEMNIYRQKHDCQNRN